MNKSDRTFFIGLCVIGAALLTSASAQDASKNTAAATPAVINLWPGVAPGSEEWKQTETVLGSGNNRRMVNVATPTLTVTALPRPKQTAQPLLSPPEAAS